jgi:hypothetical protein
LLVRPNGNKFWRFRYRFLGVDKTLALGSYPATSLADARRKRDDARRVLEAGADPAVQKKLARLQAETAARCTFGLIVSEHLERMAANGAAPVTMSPDRLRLGPSARSRRPRCWIS